jgi:hypothetical protein
VETENHSLIDNSTSQSTQSIRFHEAAASPSSPPCTRLGEYTPPENWPEGSTFDWLKNSLNGHFELLHHSDEPFLIRETARKFQWTASLLSVWRRL